MLAARNIARRNRNCGVWLARSRHRRA